MGPTNMQEGPSARARLSRPLQVETPLLLAEMRTRQGAPARNVLESSVMEEPITWGEMEGLVLAMEEYKTKAPTNWFYGCNAGGGERSSATGSDTQFDEIALRY